MTQSNIFKEEVEACKCELDGFLGAVTARNCPIHFIEQPQIGDRHDVSFTCDQKDLEVKGERNRLIEMAKEEERERILAIVEKERQRQRTPYCQKHATKEINAYVFYPKKVV